VSRKVEDGSCAAVEAGPVGSKVVVTIQQKREQAQPRVLATGQKPMDNVGCLGRILEKEGIPGSFRSQRAAKEGGRSSGFKSRGRGQLLEGGGGRLATGNSPRHPGSARLGSLNEEFEGVLVTVCLAGNNV
jgi:hypothetical protein